MLPWPELQIQTPRFFLPLLRPLGSKEPMEAGAELRSHFFAEALVENILCEHNPASCVREVQNSIKDKRQATY